MKVVRCVLFALTSHAFSARDALVQDISLSADPVPTPAATDLAPTPAATDVAPTPAATDVAPTPDATDPATANPAVGAAVAADTSTGSGTGIESVATQKQKKSDEADINFKKTVVKDDQAQLKVDESKLKESEDKEKLDEAINDVNDAKKAAEAAVQTSSPQPGATGASSFLNDAPTPASTDDPAKTAAKKAATIDILSKGLKDQVKKTEEAVKEKKEVDAKKDKEEKENVDTSEKKMEQKAADAVADAEKALSSTTTTTTTTTTVASAEPPATPVAPATATQ